MRSLLASACLILCAVPAVLADEPAFGPAKEVPSRRSEALSFSTESAASCTTGNTQCGASKSGQLSTDDCVLSDKSYVDYYIFQGTAGNTVTIEMTSSSVDTYLFLRDPSNDFVAANDDTDTTNSRLIYRLNRSGTWTIGATSARSYETGNYSLALQCVDLGSPNLTPYRPSTWSDKIIVSTVQDATSDSTPLRSGMTLYLRWAVINSGRVPVEPSTRVYVEVFVDGISRTRGYVDDDWPADWYFYWNSFSVGSLAPGTHTVRVKADSTDVVPESDETDNEYTKTFEVLAQLPPPPAASFSFAPTTPTINEPIHFADSSTNGPTSWFWDFGDGANSSERNPNHAYASPGSYTIRMTATNAGGSGSTTRTIIVILPPPCVSSTTKLCLNNGRFGVQVAWNARGRTGGAGNGTAVKLTGDTGYFWFFSASNVELVVKVVDGRAFNDRYWVFYGAMSDVEYTVTVTDSVTGRVKSYFNPNGTLASVADTAAFLPAESSSSPFGDASEEEGEEVAAATSGRAPSEAYSSTSLEATCSANPFALCLNGGRFSVEVAFASASSSGLGNAMPLTTDTGYFWFFSASNVELVIKVVDGRAFNGFFWVFYGALSDVEYTITVTDTLTGAVKRYTNPHGRLASTADTAAFR
jgi:PKD repeat protein